MKLRTSYFNGTVLKKDITRFAPVWGLYGVFLLLSLPVIYNESPLRMARDLADFCDMSVLIQFFYGGICATMLFGDLFTPKMCNALHAMPLRREGWFLNRLAAGLLFFLVPTGAITLLMLPLIQTYWTTPLLFFSVNTLAFLFFFGTGAFCCLCAGNRLGMATLYGILHFLPVFFYGAVYVFYEPFLYGLTLDAEPFFHCSPVIALTECDFIDYYTPGDEEALLAAAEYNLDAWQYLGWTALVGAIALGLTVLLYRRRELEAAGDFLAFPWVKPVFLAIYCLSVGLVVYLLGDVFGTDTSYFFLLAGLAVGFFTGLMLLRRTVRVFKGKAFLTFGLILGILGLSMGAMALDMLGIVRRIPNAGKIESAEISTAYGWAYAVELTEPDEIETVRSLHKDCLETRGNFSGNSIRIGIRYTLDNGQTVRRQYPVDVNTPQGDWLRRHFSTWQCVLGAQEWDELLSRVEDISVENMKEYDVRYEKVDAKALLEAIRRDCEAGVMAQNYSFHNDEECVAWVELVLLTGEGSRVRMYQSIQIFEGCENTLEYIAQLPTEPNT